jgi:anti-sigma regulatory factor (Ser/Thr protein kinase)
MTIDDQVQLPPEPPSARAARQFVATALRASEADVELASLLVSELVSNVVLHAQTAFEVAVRSRGDYVRITVSDESPVIPAVKAYSQDSVTGRGLAMVNSSAARWGIDEHPRGKAVWFELPTAQAATST